MTKSRARCSLEYFRALRTYYLSIGNERAALICDQAIDELLEILDQ